MPSICPRCTTAVYLTEQMPGPGGLWHKACLKCMECKKPLDSTTLNSKENNVYCNTCYGRLFGPKGYGYGGGAGVLSTETTLPTTTQQKQQDQPQSDGSSDPSIPSGRVSDAKSKFMASSSGTGPTSSSTSTSAKPKFGGSSGCPVCSKPVYFAEQAVGPGGVMHHKSCLKCSTCAKMLDSMTVTEREQKLYCKACYAKAFGPKGYGYGGGGAFMHTV